MFNEAYCRDTSIKIRSQLEIKRQRGDFIGSFAVFGYKKDPGDHHKLVIDEFAADVVRDIFNWKLDGISAIDIATRLTTSGIPTPMDYKLSQGMRYTTAFRIKERSEWSAGMVLRILKNPVYTGVLEQGRVTTPSYRVKRLVQKPRDQWAVVEDCHEPIIDTFDFKTAQRVLAMDTRTAEAGQPVDLFSGMVYCGECGGPMIRKTVPSGNKKYVYYVCAAHKNQKDELAVQITKLQGKVDSKAEERENAFIEKFKGFFEAGDVPDDMLRDLLKVVRVFPGGRMVIEWNYADAFMTKADIQL